MRLLIFSFCTAFLFVLSGCGQKFSSEKDCLNHVSRHSITQAKLAVGQRACEWAFVDLAPYTKSPEIGLYRANKKNAQCILDDFGKISDNSSGIRVLHRCALDSKATSMGKVLAMNFERNLEPKEESTRVLGADKFPEHADELKLINQEIEKPLFLNIDGQVKLCFKTANQMNCD